jgi:hypothetical protein
VIAPRVDYPSADGLVLSQDVYFLGYPLPERVRLVGTLPFVKRGIASGRAEINGVHVWLVDGHINPGFSGGPVVFNQTAYCSLLTADRLLMNAEILTARTRQGRGWPNPVQALFGGES